MKKAIILSIALTLIISGCSLKKTDTAMEILGVEEADAKVEKFINDNLLSAGAKATVVNEGEDYNMYKYKVALSTGQEITAYMTKDGKKFFPQAMDIEETEKEATDANNNNTPPAANAPKSDKPKVEVYVMSHCPYGTQIEKGIIPVVEALGDNIDFELKFCDYAMHDKKELDEQLVQHCIQKNEPNKLISYLNCFLESGNSAPCLTSAGINQGNLDSCVDATDKEFKVTEMYNDKSTWKSGRFPSFNVNAADAQKYGVQGSPTLVINETKITSGRDSASLLKTICSAFNNEPEACSKTLSSAAPSPGFGTGTTNSTTNADCGG